MAERSEKRAYNTRESLPTVPPLTPSAITQCPAEIWGTIFALACIDDGFTGRALSRVSRYIMETSRPYKYQSLAVTQCHFRPLTAILKELPAERRRIRYLFLWEQSWMSCSYTRGSRASELFHTDKNHLLMLAAATLKLLEVGCHFYQFAVPFQLPVLAEMILHGYPDHIQPSHNIVACYPVLRCLFLEHFPTVEVEDFPALLNTTATSLAKIRFTFSLDYVWNMVLPQLKARTQIQKILIQAEYCNQEKCKSWCRNLKHNSELRDALVVLEPSLFTYGPIASINRWSEVCRGHLDHWQLPEDEIDLEALAAVTNAS
ncbi:hypothetical protein PILCRDRAFT_814940 [Piloderma croceum F 1598]|uniref:F-box domain-containing protein n=1 Tax=Piloderma croceum (strain F 1598) TaxID=765440 RepID=A0A0C3BLT9_PILCF|nr:hypothetical protein PILCRDRAFT_814940 [Piloderma croceum F 1598]